MKTLTLDNQEVNWTIRNGKNDYSVRSSHHLRARQTIFEVLPTVQVLEEVPIKVYFGKTLFLDFYVPLYKTAIEVMGEQHYKFVPHFHPNKFKFLEQKRNDQIKLDWCYLNKISIIELKYNESVDEWRKKLALGRENTEDSGDCE